MDLMVAIFYRGLHGGISVEPGCAGHVGVGANMFRFRFSPIFTRGVLLQHPVKRRARARHSRFLVCEIIAFRCRKKVWSVAWI